MQEDLIENIENIFAKLKSSNAIIDRHPENFEDDQFELGYIAAFETILREIKNRKSINSILHLIASHYDFLLSIEKNEIDEKNKLHKDLSYLSYALANRIIDETNIEDDEDKEKLRNTMTLLFRHNPFAIDELSGTTIFEEYYNQRI